MRKANICGMNETVFSEPTRAWDGEELAAHEASRYARNTL